MKDLLTKIRNNHYITLGIKIILSLIFIVTAIQILFINGLEPYYTCEDYIVKNEYDNAVPITDQTQISWKFEAEGNILSNISVYFGEVYDQDIAFSIVDGSGNILKTVNVNPADYTSNEWNKIAVDYIGLDRQSQYELRVSSSGELTSVCVSENTLLVGFQFTYRYLSVGSIFEICFNILFLALFTIALCYAIFKFEDLYRLYMTSKKKVGIWYAVFFSVSYTLLYNPLAAIRNEVIDFKRVMGAGLLENADVSRRISNFNHWFILLGVSFVLFFLLSNYLLQKEWREECRHVIGFLDNLIVLANVNLLLRCITYFYDEENSLTVFYYSTYFIMVAIVVIFAYLALQLDRIITAEQYAKLMMIGFSLAFPIAFVFTREWDRAKVLLGVQTVLFTLLILLIKFGKKLLNVNKVIGGFNSSVIMLSMLPFVTSFFIELINILNQYGVSLSHMRMLYMLAILIWLSITCVFCFVAYRRRWKLTGWKKWSYPWAIFGISCLSVQSPLEYVLNASMFESANSSILVSDFLNFGSIPIVEHYGGHMMTSVWEGLIYAVLNHDYSGAIFCPYSGYILTVITVLFFCFIRYIWDEDIALFVTLFFPFYNSWRYFGLGMLVCMAILSYLKKNTYPRAALVWLSVIWCIIYRLDLGYSYAFAGSAALLIYIIVYKKWSAVKPLLTALICWGGVGAAAWFSICLIKGISPLKRLLEFLMISASNINWSYDTIGDVRFTVFAWAYIFIPFTMVIGLIYTVFSKRLREQAGEKCWVILLILEISYFANFSRGLVRHTLHEMATRVIFWSAYICIAALISFYRNNRKWFLPLFTVLILCNTHFVQGENFTEAPISNTAAFNMGTPREIWSQWKEPYANGEVVTRVRWDDRLVKTIEPYQTVIDALLEDDETFVDFINKSFVYSAINRKNPVYVSQSPGQLSGEFTQKMFVEEMQDVPIVLMPIDTESYSYLMDGIANNYRYYKVAEHIFINYVPLCQYGDVFAVWCLENRYDEMKAKAEVLADADLSCRLISYGYDEAVSDEDGNINVLHTSSIKQLPLIWAKEDAAVKNDVVTELTPEGDLFTFDENSVTPEADGNYLLINVTYHGEDMGIHYGVDDETVNAVITVGNYDQDVFTERYKYHVVLREGNHDYLIRISTDYYWYTGDVNAVRIQSDAALHDVTMKILQGD